MLVTARPIATSHPTARPTAIQAAPRAAVASADADPVLDEAVLAEIRTALRGRTAAELTLALGRPPVQVEATLRALVARGRIAPRGPRWFMA
jgi:hypothetical protein